LFCAALIWATLLTRSNLPLLQARRSAGRSERSPSVRMGARTGAQDFALGKADKLGVSKQERMTTPAELLRATPPTG
jgi:hypothetical protein